MSECPHGLFDVCCTNHEKCTLGSPKREWQGLTDEEVTACWKDGFDSCEQKTVADLRDFIARAIEAKLKEKNT